MKRHILSSSPKLLIMLAAAVILFVIAEASHSQGAGGSYPKQWTGKKLPYPG